MTTFISIDDFGGYKKLKRVDKLSGNTDFCVFQRIAQDRDNWNPWHPMIAFMAWPNGESISDDGAIAVWAKSLEDGLQMVMKKYATN